MSTKKTTTPRKKGVSKQGLANEQYLELGNLAELIASILSNELTPQPLRDGILNGLAVIDCHSEVNYHAVYVGAILVTHATMQKGSQR